MSRNDLTLWQLVRSKVAVSLMLWRLREQEVAKAKAKAEEDEKLHKPRSAARQHTEGAVKEKPKAAPTAKVATKEAPALKEAPAPKWEVAPKEVPKEAPKEAAATAAVEDATKYTMELLSKNKEAPSKVLQVQDYGGQEVYY